MGRSPPKKGNHTKKRTPQNPNKSPKKQRNFRGFSEDLGVQDSPCEGLLRLWGGPCEDLGSPYEDFWGVWGLPKRILGFSPLRLTSTGLAAPRPLDDALPGVHEPPKFGASPLGGFGVFDAPLGHRHPFLEGEMGKLRHLGSPKIHPQTQEWGWGYPKGPPWVTTNASKSPQNLIWDV